MYRQDGHGVGEDSNKDRGKAVEQVRRIAHDKGYSPTAEFGEINSTQQSDGNSEKRRQQQDFAGTDNGVGHAPAGLPDRLRKLGEEIPIHVLTAFVDKKSANQQDPE